MPSDWSTRLYHRVMDPLLDHARWRWSFLIGIVVLLAASAALVLFGAVQIKRIRHAMAAALTADAVGIAGAVVGCSLYFSYNGLW